MLAIYSGTIMTKEYLLTMIKINESQLAKWQQLTNERIEKILNSPNMEIPQGANVYYLSPNGNDDNDGTSPQSAWKTLSKLEATHFEDGTYICFERGGLWRGQIHVQKGVTYTAYGVGDKPKIYRSLINGADPALWVKTDAENIWAIQLDKNDVGTLVFNNGAAHAIKCVIRTEKDGSTYNNTTGEVFNSYADLTTDLHFFHDYYKTGILYLYSEQNPGCRFSSIEFNQKGNAFNVSCDNVTVDNLCIKYTGSHGIGAGTVNNLTVQNCEFGWIGGSIQAEGIFGRNYGTRFGNAVEIYGGCDVFNVTDNYIYQVYDAGITQQLNNSTPVYQKNMNYSRNVIEYCNYSIEYFLSGSDSNPSRMENFLIEDNYMWYAGSGLCEQRPDKSSAAHIKGWFSDDRNRATNYVVRRNLFLCSKEMLFDFGSLLFNPDGSNSMPHMEDNHILGKHGQLFGVISCSDKTRKIYNEAIVDYLEGISSNDTFWFYTEE